MSGSGTRRGKSSSHKGSSQKPSSSKHSESAPTRPISSFLFVVNELPINDDPSNGGVVPRVDVNGRWLPPEYSAGFGPQHPGRVFRWTDGEVTAADGYQWDDGDRWGPGNAQLTQYRVTTMFYSNPWTQHLTANGDATIRDIATSDFPNHRWFPLSFEHDGTLSRLNEAGEHQYLAGTGSRWIGQLGLQASDNQRAPPSTGLAGNLATIIALMAFSCPYGDFENILLNDRAWHGRRWRGHNRGHGYVEKRGVVATVYLDPENPQGSTGEILSQLEWDQGPIVR